MFVHFVSGAASAAMKPSLLMKNSSLASLRARTALAVLLACVSAAGAGAATPNPVPEDRFFLSVGALAADKVKFKDGGDAFDYGRGYCFTMGFAVPVAPRLRLGLGFDYLHTSRKPATGTRGGPELHGTDYLLSLRLACYPCRFVTLYAGAGGGLYKWQPKAGGFSHGQEARLLSNLDVTCSLHPWPTQRVAIDIGARCMLRGDTRPGPRHDENMVLKGTEAMFFLGVRFVWLD